MFNLIFTGVELTDITIKLTGVNGSRYKPIGENFDSRAYESNGCVPVEVKMWLKNCVPSLVCATDLSTAKENAFCSQFQMSSTSKASIVISYPLRWEDPLFILANH